MHGSAESRELHLQGKLHLLHLDPPGGGVLARCICFPSHDSVRDGTIHDAGKSTRLAVTAKCSTKSMTGLTREFTI